MHRSECELLFVTSLPLIERLSRFFCRESRMSAEDVEDFVAHVRLQLLDDDYAAFRSFEGRCSLATYLGLVIQRRLFDYRDRHWGRFRASAAAQRLGAVAVRLETLLRRDGLTVTEAVAAMRRDGDAITTEEAERMALLFPERRPRVVETDLDDVAPALAIGCETIELEAEASERQAVSRQVTEVMREVMAELPVEDRTILRLHFVAGMSVAGIARSLGVDQRQTYRRIPRICAALRERLAERGLSGIDVESLVGRADVDLDFGLCEVEIADDASSIDVEGAGR